MNCTRCECTGFINLHQLPEDVLAEFEATGDHEIVLRWIEENGNHDVAVCDCCGNGENWHGEPGLHNLLDVNLGTPECI